LPFHQRWLATLRADGERIDGRWEISPNGEQRELDFELSYERIP
jgi:hypothetical protein